jgi:hypothetical protein
MILLELLKQSRRYGWSDGDVGGQRYFWYVELLRHNDRQKSNNTKYDDL